jgi:hypothetical protein
MTKVKLLIHMLSTTLDLVLDKMKDLVEAISSKNFAKAETILEDKFKLIMEKKFLEMRKIFAAEFSPLEEATRIKIIKARVRGGKIQRRKKVSAVSGYAFRQGKLQRMSPAERRRRKLGQRRGAMKRRRTLSTAIRKRKRSIIKRRAFGG